MSNASQAVLRAFVRRTTRLGPVADLDGIRLHQADDVMTMMQLAGAVLGLEDPPLPFWAFAWAGGLAVSRHLVDHPEEVAGRSVLDVATGSGLCAFVALRMGATTVHAVDVDPLSEAAVSVNARANGARIQFSRRDLLDEPPPPADVIIAGDVCYEESMASRMVSWLGFAARRGTRVLVGDPGRRYLPEDLRRLSTYRVATTREIERTELTTTSVFTFPG